MDTLSNIPNEERALALLDEYPETTPETIKRETMEKIQNIMDDFTPDEISEAIKFLKERKERQTTGKLGSYSFIEDEEEEEQKPNPNVLLQEEKTKRAFEKFQDYMKANEIIIPNEMTDELLFGINSNQQTLVDFLVSYNLQIEKVDKLINNIHSRLNGDATINDQYLENYTIYDQLLNLQNILIKNYMTVFQSLEDDDDKILAMTYLSGLQHLYSVAKENMEILKIDKERFFNNYFHPKEVTIEEVEGSGMYRRR